MVQVHRYEESEDTVRSINRPSVFLAGPTVRGNQPHLTSWRFEAIEDFINKIKQILINLKINKND